MTDPTLQQKLDPLFSFDVVLTNAERIFLINEIPECFDDFFMECHPEISKKDLENTLSKLESKNFNFTKNEANIIQSTAFIINYCNDNIVNNRTELASCIRHKFWNLNHLWASGFLKYKNQDEVKAWRIQEAKDFNENFIGFDANKNMVFKGGNPVVYNVYGKHIVTGASIHGDETK